MGLHGCALSVTRLPCLLIPRASPWCLSLRWANLGPAPLPFTIFCPPALPRAGREGAQGPRHSHAEVRSPERPVPGWLPCLYRRPLGGRGWKQGCHCCPRCARLVSLPHVRPRRALYEGLPIRTSGQNRCCHRTRAAASPGHGRRRNRSVPGHSPELRPSLPLCVGQDGGCPRRQSSLLQKVFSALIEFCMKVLKQYERESCALLFNSARPWTIQSMAFSRSEHWSLSLLQWIFPTQGLNPGLLQCRRILHCLSHQGKPS